MEYLMENAVIPYLRKRFRLEHQVIQYRVLRACGLGEGALGLQIKDLMKESKNPTVGTLAAVGDVRIRITAKADDRGGASALIENMEREIRNRQFADHGVDGDAPWKCAKLERCASLSPSLTPHRSSFPELGLRQFSFVQASSFLDLSKGYR
jgi:hypothetical protein